MYETKVTRVIDTMYEHTITAIWREVTTHMTQSEIRKLSNELSCLLKSFAIHLNVDLLRTSKYPSSMALFVQFTLCFVNFATLLPLKNC